MSEQLSFSAVLDRLNTEPEKTDEAIARADDHADLEWKTRALATIQMLCLNRDTFTADDLWLELEKWPESTKEPRALGAILRAAQEKEWCKACGFVASTLPRRHKRPVTVWKSLIRW